MHLDGAGGSLTYRAANPPQVPLFFNQSGVSSIEIGVFAFDCMGVPAPDNHPHVYLNMGMQANIRCPYCSTQYRFNPALRWNETIPPGCWVGSRVNTLGCYGEFLQGAAVERDRWADDGGPSAD